MTLFLGGCKTLIVEEDDETAERYAKTLSNFPTATNVRSKSNEEALAILFEDDSIEQVLIGGYAYTVEQALPMLRP